MLPSTPAGKTLTLWLEGYNSGDNGKLRSFVETHHSEHVEKILAFRERFGGFDLIKIESSAPFELSVIVKEREGDSFRRGTEVADKHSALCPPARAQQSLRAVDPPTLPVSFFPVATSVAAIGESLPDRSRQYNQSG